MENSELQKDMIESEQEFRSQFDPTSESYHKGIQVPVPLGGKRVPETMKQEYPENVQNLNEYIQKEEAKEDFGPEFQNVTNIRLKFLEAKKILAKWSALVETVFRNKDSAQKEKEELASLVVELQ